MKLLSEFEGQHLPVPLRPSAAHTPHVTGASMVSLSSNPVLVQRMTTLNLGTKEVPLTLDSTKQPFETCTPETQRRATHTHTSRTQSLRNVLESCGTQRDSPSSLGTAPRTRAQFRNFLFLAGTNLVGFNSQLVGFSSAIKLHQPTDVENVQFRIQHSLNNQKENWD